MFAGRTKPFRGDEHPLERLLTNFLSKATESYKERLWRTGQRRGSHALRAYLNSVPTLSYPRQPASSAWTTASMLIGGFSPPKLVKSTAKRGSRGVFCPFPPPKMTKWAGSPWGYRKTSVNANATPQKNFYPKVLGGLRLLSRSPQAYPSYSYKSQFIAPSPYPLIFPLPKTYPIWG